MQYKPVYVVTAYYNENGYNKFKKDLEVILKVMLESKKVEDFFSNVKSIASNRGYMVLRSMSMYDEHGILNIIYGLDFAIRMCKIGLQLRSMTEEEFVNVFNEDKQFMEHINNLPKKEVSEYDQWLAEQAFSSSD